MLTKNFWVKIKLYLDQNKFLGQKYNEIYVYQCRFIGQKSDIKIYINLCIDINKT